MSNLVGREMWLEEMYTLHEGSDPTWNGNGLFLEPQTINPFWARESRAVIKRQIDQNLDDDPLYGSTIWDQIVRDPADIDDTLWLHDEHIARFFSDRAEQVRQAGAHFIDEFPISMETIYKGVVEGRRLGYLPTTVDKDRFDDFAEEVAWRVVDEQVLSDDSSATFLGDYLHQENTIRISHNDIARLETTAHELAGHAIAGATFCRSTDDSAKTKCVRTRTGFQEETGNHRALDEALAEHTALAIMDGNWEELDPRERRDSGVYYDERVLLAEFISRACGLIDLRTMSVARYEDTTSDGGFAQRKAMIEQVVSAYGWGALRDFEALYDIEDESLLDRLGRIHGPRFDFKGRVIEKGYIDLS